MSRKPQFTREQVINVAVAQTKEIGINVVSARTLAKELKCTVIPLFTLFESMQEIKDCIYKETRITLANHLKQSFDYKFKFKAFCFYFVKFAVEEPLLYRVLFGDYKVFNPYGIIEEFQDVVDVIIEDICTTFNLNAEEAILVFKNMIVYCNGLSNLICQGLKLTDEEITLRITRNCIGIVSCIQIENNKFDYEKIKDISTRLTVKPL